MHDPTNWHVANVGATIGRLFNIKIAAINGHVLHDPTNWHVINVGATIGRQINIKIAAINRRALHAHTNFNHFLEFLPIILH